MRTHTLRVPPFAPPPSPFKSGNIDYKSVMQWLSAKPMKKRGAVVSASACGAYGKGSNESFAIRIRSRQNKMATTFQKSGPRDRAGQTLKKKKKPF
ncbi:unnamed protein product [Caenorhabditis auriculariae]|uniref:Uncharacterized protein n=1 Tax=Caenorhabditis auriculariae TaxID=2777116 RepID=A0A8S1HPK1_9PELO|nr:unnamed protein product [Caenorhabditis auriculariae]